MFEVNSWIQQITWQTVGPATEKARLSNVLRRTRGWNWTENFIKHPESKNAE